MRVLVVTTSYPRWEGDAGGHFVASQVAGWSRGGASVRVLAPGRASGLEVRPACTLRWTGGERAFGWPGVVARLRLAPVLASVDLLRAVAGLARALREELATFRPERLVVHWLVPSAWPLLAAVEPDVPVTAHAHGGDVRLLLGLPGPLRRRLCAAILDRVDGLVFASHSLRDALEAGLDDVALSRRLRERSTVELPPLELDGHLDGSARTAGRARLFAGSDRVAASTAEVLAIGVGRLVASKRFDLAIEAASALGHVHLVLIGDGPMRPKLEVQARDRGASVTFLGRLDRSDALAHLAAADVLVHPSEAEAAPTVVREARALGVPVITCGAGDTARWSLEDPDIRCVPRTAEALRAALEGMSPASRSRAAPGESSCPQAVD